MTFLSPSFSEKRLLSTMTRGQGIEETHNCRVCNGVEVAKDMFPMADGTWLCEICTVATDLALRKEGSALVHLIAKLLTDLDYADSCLKKVKKALAPKNTPSNIVFKESWLKKKAPKRKRNGR